MHKPQQTHAYHGLNWGLKPIYLLYNLKQTKKRHTSHTFVVENADKQWKIEKQLSITSLPQNNRLYYAGILV